MPKKRANDELTQEDIDLLNDLNEEEESPDLDFEDELMSFPKMKTTSKFDDFEDDFAPWKESNFDDDELSDDDDEAPKKPLPTSDYTWLGKSKSTAFAKKAESSSSSSDSEDEIVPKKPIVKKQAKPVTKMPKFSGMSRDFVSLTQRSFYE